VAVGSNRYFGLKPRRINDFVDYVFVMTYDLGLMHSNFYLSKAFVMMWNILGISREKICIGVPLYGRNVKHLDSDRPFNELYKGKITRTFGQSFSEYNGSVWCFDTEADVKAKSEWAAKRGFGGIFCWEIFGDIDNRILSLMYGQ